MTAIPDVFCQFETDDCIWQNSNSITWKWNRRKISDLEPPRPEADHRGNTSSIKDCYLMEINMSSIFSGYIMFLSSKDVDAGDSAILESENMMLYEGDTKCLSFWYMFESGREEESMSLESLTVFTEDTEDHIYTAWKLTESHDYWNMGQVALTKGGDLRIKFEVVHGTGHVPAYVALDDIRIVTYTGEEDVICDPLPPLDSTTKEPCSEQQVKCKDGTCLGGEKRCNFIADCPNDSTDEEGCLPFFDFNDCSDLDNCFWKEMVGDNLDWVIAETSNTGSNGPDTNWQNTTSGKFLYVKAKEGNIKQGAATIQSPMYQDSNTDCSLHFHIYLSGPDNPTILPVFELIEQSCDECIIVLDRIDKEVIVEGSWSKVEIGIGRHTEVFSVGFIFSYNSEDTNFDGGVAIDDIDFFGCALPPKQESCGEDQFQCSIGKGCIAMTDRCDLADNCGDLSDEVIDCDNFTKSDFENPSEPFGIFTQVDETPNFKWKLGNGTTSQDGTGPPFDHTHFNPMGHYLYIDSKLQNANDKAWLSSPIISSDESQPEGCRVRLFYHMHGLHVGNLTFYRE